MDQQAVVRFFDAAAPSWDEAPRPDEAKLARILDAAEVRAGYAVLDVACGTGVLFPRYFARGVCAVLGVDISSEMIRVAREKFGAEPRLSLLCADAAQADYPRRFDRCVIFNAFPHFSAPEALLRRLYGALVPGGRLTVAHDRGRAALAAHHRSVGAISQPLPPAETLAALLRRLGFVQVTACEAEDIYLVSGAAPQADTET